MTDAGVFDVHKQLVGFGFWHRHVFVKQRATVGLVDYGFLGLGDGALESQGMAANGPSQVPNTAVETKSQLKHGGDFKVRFVAFEFSMKRTSKDISGFYTHRENAGVGFGCELPVKKRSRRGEGLFTARHGPMQRNLRRTEIGLSGLG